MHTYITGPVDTKSTHARTYTRLTHWQMLLDNRNMKENPSQGPYNDVIANNAKLPRIGVGINGGTY